MSRYSVPDSIRMWDLGQMGELHEVSRASGKCSLWCGDKNPSRCQGHVRFVWASAGRSDVSFCNRHGLDTFPEARNKPDSGRPLPQPPKVTCSHEACHETFDGPGDLCPSCKAAPMGSPCGSFCSGCSEARE